MINYCAVSLSLILIVRRWILRLGAGIVVDLGGMVVVNLGNDHVIYRYFLVHYFIRTRGGISRTEGDTENITVPW